ncbi:hypothetical protein [Nocardioides glacieisoli]|uniref:hypothetical protein n=1 Tax=Nocardioides glacieisoli TaxID=1168730 RepID=UPI0013EE239D|nr:hypothetical protein [Nocardioides glacieisoli]
MTLVAVFLVFLVLLALARFASRDSFAGASLRSQPHDELGYRYSPVIGRRG